MFPKPLTLVLQLGSKSIIYHPQLFLFFKYSLHFPTVICSLSHPRCFVNCKYRTH